MCVYIPAQVLALKGDRALVMADGNQMDVGRQFLPDAQPGDWVLLYAGQMMSVVSPDEADTIQDLRQAVVCPTLEGGRR